MYRDYNIQIETLHRRAYYCEVGVVLRQHGSNIIPYVLGTYIKRCKLHMCIMHFDVLVLKVFWDFSRNRTHELNIKNVYAYYCIIVASFLLYRNINIRIYIYYSTVILYYFYYYLNEPMHMRGRFAPAHRASYTTRRMNGYYVCVLIKIIFIFKPK